MSHHAAFLLGQALEALTTIANSVDLDAALAVATAALADIVPAAGDRPALERGARTPLECGHQRGAFTCVRDPHIDDNPDGHVYISGSWVPDRHQGAS